MHITINGTQKKVNSSISLIDLIQKTCKNPEFVIAEVNGNIIKKNVWGQKVINDGDTLELVSFVGGG